MKELNTIMKGWPYKLESSFTTAWLKTLKDKWFYVDKISDGSIGTKKVDCYIRTTEDTYCCEIKIIDNDIFPISRLRPNQRKGLRLWMELNGSAIVCVYSKNLNKYKIFNFDKIKDVDVEWSVKLKFN